MTTPRIIESNDYARLVDPEKERAHGPDSRLATYYNVANESVSLTTDEAEDFEDENDDGENKLLTADVLDDQVFEMLALFVQGDAYVNEYLQSRHLPVKPCGLNADWSARAWMLTDGDPNRTDGAFYLLDDEHFTAVNGLRADTFSIVQRFYDETEEAKGDDDPTKNNVRLIVASLPLPQCLDLFAQRDALGLILSDDDEKEAQQIATIIKARTSETIHDDGWQRSERTPALAARVHNLVLGQSCALAPSDQLEQFYRYGDVNIARGGKIWKRPRKEEDTREQTARDFAPDEIQGAI